MDKEEVLRGAPIIVIKKALTFALGTVCSSSPEKALAAPPTNLVVTFKDPGTTTGCL